MRIKHIPFNRSTVEEFEKFVKIDREERNINITIDGDELFIDPSIADLVTYLNNIDYPTEGCGSGIFGEHYDFSKVDSNWDEITSILGSSSDYILDDTGAVDNTEVARVLSTSNNMEQPFVTTELWFDEVDVDTGVRIGTDYFKLKNICNVLYVNNNPVPEFYASHTIHSRWSHIVESGEVSGHYSIGSAHNPKSLFTYDENHNYPFTPYGQEKSVERYDKDMRSSIDLIHILLKGFLELDWNQVGESYIYNTDSTFEVFDNNDDLLASGDVDDFINRDFIDERINTYKS